MSQSRALLLALPVLAVCGEGCVYGNGRQAGAVVRTEARQVAERVALRASEVAIDDDGYLRFRLRQRAERSWVDVPLREEVEQHSYSFAGDIIELFTAPFALVRGLGLLADFSEQECRTFGNHGRHPFAFTEFALLAIWPGVNSKRFAGPGGKTGALVEGNAVPRSEAREGHVSEEAIRIFAPAGEDLGELRTGGRGEACLDLLAHRREIIPAAGGARLRVVWRGVEAPIDLAPEEVEALADLPDRHAATLHSELARAEERVRLCTDAGYRRAARMIERALALPDTSGSPHAADASYRLGRIRFFLGDFEAAKTAFARAVTAAGAETVKARARAGLATIAAGEPDPMLLGLYAKAERSWAEAAVHQTAPSLEAARAAFATIWSDPRCERWGDRDLVSRALEDIDAALRAGGR